MAIAVRFQAGRCIFTSVADAPTGPDMPTGLNVSALSTTALRVRWTGVDGALGYLLERSAHGAGTFAQIADIDGAALFYDDSPLSPATEYDYRIRAYNDDGTSDYSTTATGLTDAEDPGPIQVYPSYVSGAIAKAIANTAQWVAFRAARDAELATVIPAGYQGSNFYSACDFALAYRAALVVDPASAPDYGGKALGLLLSGIRELMVTDGGDAYASWQYIGRGDGATTTFTLPGTPISGTLAVRSATVFHDAVTRSSTYDEDFVNYYRHIIKIATTSDGSPAYTEDVDWWHGPKSSQPWLSWLGAAAKPANGATYYVTSASTYEAPAVDSGDYSVVGDQITFDTPPADTTAIFVKHLYHGTSRYQQTYGTQGGGLASIYTDSGYTSRNMMWLAIALDWLWDFSGLTTGLKTEFMAQLVEWFDAITAGIDFFGGTEADVYAETNPDTNYGTGHYQYKLATAIALDGRHASAAAMKTNALAWRTTNLLPTFDPPPADRTTLNDGHYLEGGFYGPESAQMIARTVPMIEDAGWATPTAEKAWCASAIRSMLHQQPTRATMYSGGDGATNPHPVPDDIKWVVWAAGTNDTTAIGHANWAIQTSAGANNTDYEDLLFRDPNASANDPTDGDEPLYRFHRGSGHLFSRADWAYDSTWLAVDGQKIASGGHEPGTLGGLYLNRGADALLTNANAFSDNQASVRKSLFGSCALTDDNGENGPYYRWGPGVWHGDPGVITTHESTSAYSYIKIDNDKVYSNNSSVGGGAHVVELMREAFHVRPDYVVVYDRMETTGAAHPKHLRFTPHDQGLTATAGTFTLTYGANTTSALDFDAAPEDVQAALEGLASIGAGNVTVTTGNEIGVATSSPIGHYYVTFTGTLAGTTCSLISGDGSGLTTAEGGAGRVTVLDVTLEPRAGGSGTRTTQVILLGETNATDGFTLANGASKLFGKVYSTEALDSWHETTAISSAIATKRVRRFVTRNAASVARVCYVTVLHSAASAASAMDDAEHIVGTNEELEGARIGDEVILFPRAGESATMPETYGYEATGATMTHRISGLTPGQDYELSGDASGTVTASSAGLAIFTTTGSGSKVIAIGEAVVVPAVYGYTRVDPGVSALLNTWYAAEQTRQGVGSGVPAWWLWQVTAMDWLDSNYPSLLIGHHAAPGLKYFRNTCSTPGGAIGFVDATTSELSANAWDLGVVPGEIVVADIDGDGIAQHGCRGTTAPSNRWWDTSTGVLVNTGISTSAHTNYFEDIGDFEPDGDLEFKATAWPVGAALTSFAAATVYTYYWGESPFRVTSAPYALPAGVPGAVAADVLSRLQNPTPGGEGQLFTLYMDLDNDGLDDLILLGRFSYTQDDNFFKFLKNNGDGTYTDKTTDWGLTGEGNLLPLCPYWMMRYPRSPKCDAHLHSSIDGTGAMHVFVSNDTSTGGMYRWNGSAYVLVAGTLTNTLKSALTKVESYMAQLYAVDLTNSGRLDLVYHSPRAGYFVVFMNDGAGTFTPVDGPISTIDGFYSWDPYGVIVADMNNNGLLDIVVGGTNPATGTNLPDTPGGTGRRYLSILVNATTDPGRHIKIKLRRATTANPFGVGGTVEVFQAGTAFAASGLIRRWYADPAGLPIHFGVGSRVKVDVRVNWPSGSPTTILNVDTNQTITIDGTE